MKKLFILPILMLSLTGCNQCKETPEYDNAWAMYGSSIMTKVVQIEGHRYIVLRGTYAGTIIHAESCDCKK
jgi:uncharacterized protein YcfL